MKSLVKNFNDTLLLSFLLLSVTSTAQSVHNTSKKVIELYKTADNLRVRGEYKQAIVLLHKAISKDAKFAEAYFTLGQTYKAIKQYTNASTHLETGLHHVQDEKTKRLFCYELGECFFLTGDYQRAYTFLKKYVDNEPLTTQNKNVHNTAKRMMNNIEFATQQKEKKYDQHPVSDTVNRFLLQYFPVLTADQQSLIFTRRTGNKSNDDEDIVVSIKNPDGTWQAPVSISDKINSPLNEGTCTISADGRQLILTSCSGRDGLGSCDLYESQKIGNEWTLPKNLGTLVNSSGWESQPSLSADGHTLYFVSDRKGGVGGRDIWKSKKDTSGRWTKPDNLGKNINTPYDEISPFIHTNNKTLFFASNGLPGFGGFDIYSTYKENDDWTNPVNVGNMVNDHQDQFSFFITADGAKAYYSHEQVDEQGMVYSKIYEIEIPENEKLKIVSSYVRGVIRDKVTQKPLKASVELVNLENGQTETRVQSDSVTGEYLITLTKGMRYLLYIYKEDYLFQSINIEHATNEWTNPTEHNILLQPIRAGSVAILNNIFFDFNQYILKDNSFQELDKVIRLLKKNKFLKIEVVGHTDSVGIAAYNIELSTKRAAAVVRYLAEHGVPSEQMRHRGLGANEPIADNSTEKGREMNRRIEFRILSK